MFYDLTMSPTGLCTNPVRHIRCLSCATCHFTCHVVWRGSSAIKFDRVEIAFILALWAEPLNSWMRRGKQSTQRKSLVMSFGNCHILKPEDSNPKQDLNLHNSIDGRLEKQTCKLLHHMSPPWGHWCDELCSFCLSGFSVREELHLTHLVWWLVNFNLAELLFLVWG